MALFTPVIDVHDDSSFDSKVISATVTNRIVVPEPSSILLGLTSIVLVTCVSKAGRVRAGRRERSFHV
jgi:hypothetical protein